MAMNFSDAGIVFNDGSVQPTALTTGTQTIAGAKTFSSNVTLSAGVQGALVLATAQNTTGVQTVDFTSIPSWVKRITVMINGTSTNGTNNILLQVGAGSILSSGYNSAISAGAGTATSAAGFLITQAIVAASAVYGHVVLTLAGSNNWIASVNVAYNSGGLTAVGGGSISVGGTLDRVRLAIVGGVDAFDAGSVNIMYEG